MRSDPFVLISGDVISNMDLKRAIAFHKEKRKEDPSCVMTMVMKRVLPTTVRNCQQNYVLRHLQGLVFDD